MHANQIKILIYRISVISIYVLYIFHLCLILWNFTAEQYHHKAAQSVVESSSQIKGQLVVNEMSSSSEYEPNSTDDSDDSDQYVRRRLIEINAKFAQEPFPPEGGKIRETKVTFKEQLVDFSAPPIDSSVTEPSDATIEWIEACGEEAVNCSSILQQPLSQPVVQELSSHLQNVQVDEPFVRSTHSKKSEDFREPTETQSPSHVIPSVKKEKTNSRKISPYLLFMLLHPLCLA